MSVPPQEVQGPFNGQSLWEQVQRCPVCDSHLECHRKFSRVTDDGTSLSYLACQVCGLVFQSPRLTQAARDTYYAESYHSQKMPARDDVNRNRWVQARRGEYLTEFARDLGFGMQNYLDIGASRGLVMQAFLQEFQCKAYGVEPGDSLRLELADKDLQVFADLDVIPNVLINQFDLITMSHTLEHLPEPREYLAELAKRWLAPEGVLIVEVPNLYWHPALEFSHLTAFTHTSLHSLASQSGFRVRQMTTHGRPYSRRLPLFLLAALEPHKESEVERVPTPPLGWMRLRRWFGINTYKFVQWGASLLYKGGEMSPWRD